MRLNLSYGAHFVLKLSFGYILADLIILIIHEILFLLSTGVQKFISHD